MPVQSAPITLQEAERVWKSQARPSARSVARALTQARRPVHFTTVARWKRQGLLTIARTSESAEPEASPENLFAELPPPVSPLEAKRVWDEFPVPLTSELRRSPLLYRSGFRRSSRRGRSQRDRTGQTQLSRLAIRLRTASAARSSLKRAHGFPLSRSRALHR